MTHMHFIELRETSTAPDARGRSIMDQCVVVAYCQPWAPDNPQCEWMVPGTYVEVEMSPEGELVTLRG